MRFSQRIVYLQRFQGRPLRHGSSPFGRGCAVLHEGRVAIGDTRVGRRVVRRELNRPLEILNGLRQILVCPLVPEPAPPQVEVVRLRTRVGPFHQLGLLVSKESHSELVHDGQGDLVLDCEDVFHVPVELLGPEMAPVRGVDELSRDPEA